MKHPLPALLLAALFSTATPLFGLTPEYPCVPAIPASVTAKPNWSGDWRTNWGELTICALGDRFEGHYGEGHTIEGKFDPAKPHLLTGRWKHEGGALSGRMTFAMTGVSQFLGAWALGENDPSLNPAGLWTGQLAMLVEDDDKAAVELKGEAVGEGHVSKNGQCSQKFQLTNVSGKTVYVYGHSKTAPFTTPATRNPDSGKWESLFMGYCGTGAGRHALAPGESFAVTTIIDQKLADREISISLSIFNGPDSEASRECRVTGLRTRL